MSRTKYILGTVEERFWPKVARRGAGECWLWTASQTGNGYGQFRCEISCRSHVISYVLTNGPVPAGYVVHHTCEVKLCCNPAHLELREEVAHREGHVRQWWATADRGLVPGFTPLGGTARRYRAPDGQTISHREYNKIRKAYIARVAEGKKLTNRTVLDVYRQIHKMAHGDKVAA